MFNRLATIPVKTIARTACHHHRNFNKLAETRTMRPTIPMEINQMMDI